MKERFPESQPTSLLDDDNIDMASVMEAVARLDQAKREMANDPLLVLVNQMAADVDLLSPEFSVSKFIQTFEAMNNASLSADQKSVVKVMLLGRIFVLLEARTYDYSDRDPAPQRLN